MKKLTVFSRARRALRNVQRFQFISQESEVPARYREQLRLHEPVGDLVGIYRSPDAEQPEAVVVTEDGLIALRPGASQYIKFADVESTIGPGVGTDSNDISICLRSRIIVGLRIAGRDGRFRDVFGLAPFVSTRHTVAPAQPVR